MRGALWYGLAVIAAALVIAAWWQAGGVAEQSVQTPMNLEIRDATAGTGAQAKAGDKVKVHYTGTLADGTVFDSSKSHGAPFTFTLGAGEVIKGWDAGVAGMKVGGKRTLVIPPDLAYGNRQAGPIPPNSTLTFEVELLGVNGKK